ncbi:cytokinesis 3 [Hyphodiscus hymeniophilus]|uniref:Cytokinesis 3 n=1 Tax=Hyphodiscus hymeniophilus TaxID=353542 RepID=A0A9P6VEP3_9HELO|nr:cytokinesis 3 [Hyphodiscus hymeniophilus]
MAHTAPPLPVFPVWCRAKFSFTAESKNDLGFVEGDLIQAVNAGDGSWWVGKLGRNAREMGHFPSNFVEVLNQSFRPVSRISSRSPSPAPPPQKPKSKTFRKPFQAYSAPDAAATKRAEPQKQESLSISRTPSPQPRTVHDNIQQIPSPNIHGYGSRAPSPAPPIHYGSRAPSPVPPMHYGSRVPSPEPPLRYGSRAPSPAPSFQYEPHSSSSSPGPQFDIGSSPPPPPPPHRTAYTPDGSTNSYHRQNEYHTPRAVSPCPPSPGGTGLTPSPLRSAMDDVMSSLAGMGVGRDTELPDPPLDPWSPEAFDQTYAKAKRKGPPRPNTAVGIGRDFYDDNETGDQPYISQSQYEHHGNQPPQLSNYVQRMENRLSKMHTNSTRLDGDIGPAVPPKMNPFERPKSSLAGNRQVEQKLRHRKSAYEVGRSMLNRTFTTKTNSTSSSSATRTTDTSTGTSMTDRSIMSGSSAGGVSATSAGSLARKKDVLQGRAHSAFGSRKDNFMGTGAASARSSIAASEGSRPPLPTNSMVLNGVSSIASGYGSNSGRSAGSEMGLGGANIGIDWVQVRRDVNRSNSLSRIERIERKERCQMMDYPAISPVDELYENDGDEGADGDPVAETTNFQAVNLSLVDKNARFINSLPPMTNPVSLATGFVCRPYRSDVQRLRAIFTWVSEKITWEEECDTDVDSRRVLQTKRGCAEEVAVLVLEMCAAVGIHAEIIRGYLKTPGEVPEIGIMPRPNHWWNAVIVDGEWRFMDCSLAAPSNPRRVLYSSAGQVAESWWFLARPSEICWTHVAETHHQQHLCPPVAQEVLLSLPCACPPYFKNGIEMADYDTSLVRIEDLELVHIKFTVPSDVECVAEVEARAFERDMDGDFFESGEVVKKRALTQAEWVGGQKRYTVKALLPGDEGHGVLKVYAGKRGLMHSIKDIPHPLAFALPIVHTGDNPPYEFLTRHPTPHAQRHDLYVAQPQCQRLAVNNTFVFAVRQHPSSNSVTSPSLGGTSPVPFVRPSSAMSMTSSSASGSNPSTTNAFSSKKPAKLAIQSPGGKILRLMRKEERGQSTSQACEGGDGGTWETIIKCGERGLWRGLVLADRSARWCVFAEWTCV